MQFTQREPIFAPSQMTDYKTMLTNSVGLEGSIEANTFRMDDLNQKS